MYHIYSSIQEQVFRFFVFQMSMICWFRFQEVMGGGGVVAEISLVIADTCPSLKDSRCIFHTERPSLVPL